MRSSIEKNVLIGVRQFNERPIISLPKWLGYILQKLTHYNVIIVLLQLAKPDPVVVQKYISRVSTNESLKENLLLNAYIIFSVNWALHGMLAKSIHVLIDFWFFTPFPCYRKNNTNLYYRISPPLEKYQAALLMIIGFGGVSVILALLHNFIRRRFYDSNSSLDTVFDAGGRVTLSLTAVTVTSQQLWPADFLQSPTNAYKVIACYWNSIMFRFYLNHFSLNWYLFKTMSQLRNAQ